jgi:hypothetical protein
LLPTAAGARIELRGGKMSSSDGPFANGAEVVGGYAIFEVKSRQEAIEWATRFMKAHKDHWKGWEGETEVRQLMSAPGMGEGKPHG